MIEVIQTSEEKPSCAEVVNILAYVELRFEREALFLSAQQDARVEQIWKQSKLADPALFAGSAT